ncbi:hypothetical protein [Deinococcus apachensis]|uniref:hypothetical protein n=1 Tax=Deinococcus apachensis TaxID=309886 RepID=UPI00035FE9D9|nr:hypothetical protein [Deinococcus apachensis]
MAKVSAAGLGQLRQQLTGLALKGAEAAADTLREKLSGGGGGAQYAGQPNRSSREGEYPAEQTGRLRDSMDARQAGEMRAEFGSIIDPPEYVADLHFKAPEEGGRPFMDDALYDQDVHRAVREAVGVK